MQPADVYRLTSVSDPRVSPDGRRAAYVVTTIDEEANDYRSAIWVVPLDGSAEPRRFTSGIARDASPRWSPDGSRIAFVSSRAKPGEDPKKAQGQLYVMPADGGEPLRLTDLKEAVSAPAWSPDGTRIAFTSRVRDAAYDEEDERKRPPRRVTRLAFRLDDVGWIGDRRQHVFVVPADGSGEPSQVTDGDFDDSSPSWSPDGTRIAFSSGRGENWDITFATDLFVVNADGGEPDLLTTGDGFSAAPSWSPDGMRIAYQFTPGVRDWPRHAQIAVMDLATRDRRILTASLDRNCAPYPPMREPIWSSDHLLFATEDAGANPLYLVPADGSDKPQTVVTGQALGGYDMVAGQGVHVATTPATLPELFHGESRLTSHGAAFAQARSLASPERFTATSADGTEVDAWIMRPPGFTGGTRYPVLLSVHGGPFTQYGERFHDEFQVYAGAGYVVLYANPRGSSGYSEEWGRAIRGPSNGAGPGMGTVDYEDVMAVVDEALARYEFCDPDRLGVIGGSYGGFMATWIAAHTTRFKAAISERAVNSWTSMWGSSDSGWAFEAEVGANIMDDPAAWRAISPLEHAQNIATPLLIIHSENDLRCNAEQADQLFTTLRYLGREVEMVRFPAEGHELSRSGSPVHRVQRFEIVLEWFARHLS
ncbi:MAG TPA: S9 family peptidase [Actinomycetota bacterium]